MKAYPASRDLRVAYLGNVPGHWEALRLKFVAGINQNTLGEDTDPDLEISYVDIGNVSKTGDILGDERMSFRAAPSRARRVPSEGDTIVSTVRTYLKAIAFVGGSADEALRVCSTGFAVVAPGSRLRPRFLFYYLRSTGIVEEICARSTGVSYPAINASEIGNILALVPTVAEQDAISAYLDERTTALDRLIGAKENLLAVLDLKRQAVITDAVTKGLDPSVPEKASGVDWIGTIPAHWRCLSIKRDTVVRRGASPRPIDNPIYFDEEGEYAWVRIADVSASDGCLTETTQRLSDLGASLSVKTEPGTLFLSIAGSVGKPNITAIKCCIHDGFVYFPNLSWWTPKYLYYVFESGRAYGGLGKLGTQLNLNTDTVGGIRVPMPPLDEQERITAALGAQVFQAPSHRPPSKTLTPPQASARPFSPAQG